MRNDVQLFLSRKNLQTLIEKLDAVKEGRSSKCTIVKMDTTHPVYPMTQTGEGWLGSVTVTALEDEEYYIDREPGEMAKV